MLFEGLFNNEITLQYIAIFIKSTTDKLNDLRHSIRIRIRRYDHYLHIYKRPIRAAAPAEVHPTLCGLTTTANIPYRTRA